MEIISFFILEVHQVFVSDHNSKERNKNRLNISCRISIQHAENEMLFNIYVPLFKKKQVVELDFLMLEIIKTAFKRKYVFYQNKMTKN